MATNLTVRAEWDDEAKVWYVAESDIPGLATEADTFDELRQRVLAVIPELIAANAHEMPAFATHTAVGNVPVHVTTRTLDYVQIGR